MCVFFVQDKVFNYNNKFQCPQSYNQILRRKASTIIKILKQVLDVFAVFIFTISLLGKLNIILSEWSWK